MARCLLHSGTGTGRFPMKSQSALGIFEPNVEASTASTKSRQRQTYRRKRGSTSTGCMTRNSVVDRPGNSATQAFARYGRSFPKSTSPNSKVLLSDALVTKAEAFSSVTAALPRSFPVHDSMFSSPTYGLSSSLPSARDRRSKTTCFNRLAGKGDTTCPITPSPPEVTARYAPPLPSAPRRFLPAVAAACTCRSGG